MLILKMLLKTRISMWQSFWRVFLILLRNSPTPGLGRVQVSRRSWYLPVQSTSVNQLMDWDSRVKSSCEETLSLFTVCGEPWGPETSIKRHCSSPRSIRNKTTLSESALTLPRPSAANSLHWHPSSEMGALSPIPVALCATLRALLLLLPIQQSSLGGCSYTQEATQQPPFPEPLPLLP